jgi:hypothetical protein
MLRKRRDGYIRRNVGRNDGEKILSNFNPGKVNNPALRDAIKLIILESDEDDCLSNLKKLIGKMLQANINYYQELLKVEFNSSLTEDEFNKKLSQLEKSYKMFEFESKLGDNSMKILKRYINSYKNKTKSDGGATVYSEGSFLDSKFVTFRNFNKENYDSETGLIKDVLFVLRYLNDNEDTYSSLLTRFYKAYPFDYNKDKDSVFSDKEIDEMTKIGYYFERIGNYLKFNTGMVRFVKNMNDKPGKKDVCDRIKNMLSLDYSNNLMSQNYLFCHEFSRGGSSSSEAGSGSSAGGSSAGVKTRKAISTATFDNPERRAAVEEDILGLNETELEETNKNTLTLDGKYKRKSRKSRKSKKSKRSDGKRKKSKRSDGKRKKSKRSDGKRKKSKRSDGKRKKSKRSDGKRKKSKRSDGKRKKSKRSDGKRKKSIKM